jgi:glycosyltransferase involved in cell wall biosynthesis
MKSAKLVVFPSDGAKKMYFADNHCGCRTQDVELGPIIYNTILPKNSKPDVNHASIDIFEGLTFTSVGTLTLAKGQDQILDFFERMLPLLPNRVRWVCIGDGPLRGEILVRGDQLSKKFTNFEFKYLPRLPHKAVMNVLKLTDIYIMLHRISVFDFATLEAMSNNCAILLSKVGGNLDFDKEHNVIFMEEIDIKEMGVFSHENISRLKNINSAVLARHFSVDRFRESNFEVISRLASDTLQ